MRIRNSEGADDKLWEQLLLLQSHHHTTVLDRALFRPVEIALYLWEENKSQLEGKQVLQQRCTGCWLQYV